jgi:hypothetical protein
MTNSEVVHAIYRSVRDRDFSAFRALCAPGVVWTQNAGFPNGGVRVGADAVITGVFERFQREWTSWRYEIEQMLEVGEQIVVLGVYDGVFAHTQKHMRSDAAHVFWIEGGKIVAFRQFADTKVVHDAMQ